MKIILVSKCSLVIEQFVEFKMSVLISPSKSLISSCWVTFHYHVSGRDGVGQTRDETTYVTKAS